MKWKWLIEPEVFREDSKLVIDAFNKLGIEYIACEFGTSYEQCLAKIPDSQWCLFHGSFQFAKAIWKNHDKPIVVHCNTPQLDCCYYYPKFGESLLNSDYVMLPFGELARRQDWLFSHIGNALSVFVRPSGGFKSFTGKVIGRPDWEKEIKMLSLRTDPHELVVVAAPQRLKGEWRLVVVNKEVVAASQYKEGDKFVRIQGAPEMIMSYAKQLLGSLKYDPGMPWMLDICETDNGKAKVVEVGSFSCSGWYACDAEAILKAVHYSS